MISRVEGRSPPHWNCSCSCGTLRVVNGANLRHGLSTNCGCKRDHATKHGHSKRSGKTRTYRQWKAMRSRCRPGSHDYRNYSGRGISVCDRWDDYSLFLEDMGECPFDMSLDRINNDKGYHPDNCRWATYETQRRNQRRVSWVRYQGNKMTVQDAAQKIGVHPSAIWNDKRRNDIPIQEAVDRVASRARTRPN